MAFTSFVILAGMRTGSNFLEANLNALPGVTCHGEAFNPGFAGQFGATEAFGMTLAERDADPLRFLRRLQAAVPGLNGFRYFPDHDPRVLPALLDDPACAKIALTRSPLDSYVSWKIAQATGQWKLTNPARHRGAKAVFDAREFAAYLGRQRLARTDLLRGLQERGQAAFWIGYEDLSELSVLNGLAAFLGVTARLEEIDRTLKKQNPGSLSELVANPEEMAAALARLGAVDVDDGPVAEPRRGAAIPSFLAAGPVLHMPVRGGPEGEIAGWLAAIGPVSGDFSQKSLRRWRSGQPGARSFTVLRHPVARAWAVFSGPVLSGGLPEVRRVFARSMGLDLPAAAQVADLSADQQRDGFLAFLRFARLNLSGQTAVRVDPALATQTAVLQGFAQHQGPDLVLREARLADGLAFLAAETGRPLPSAPAIAPDPLLTRLCDAEIEAAARDAYQRDYAGFGFGALG